ncbi:HAD family hydrolase [Ruminococcaceae bacterium OttesenSCG-928-I18]|nr:HAD family hydrolase [Ruminococcaceae bacterium OttesenSCG-928-I18]
MLSQKPVLFWDFHGTLTLPDITWFDAAVEACEETFPQVRLSRRVLTEQFTGRCLPWWSIPSRDTRHLTAPGAWWGHCEKEFAKMFESCGFTKEQAETLAPKLREKVLQPSRYQLYPDALSTLRELKDRGYRQFLLSNNYPELGHLAEALGLSPYLEGVVVSAEVGYDKPRIEIFEKAWEQAGKPVQSWMVGDNYEDDIEGAHRAGFTTVYVHSGHRECPAADHCVEHLSEVPPLLP